MNSEQMAHRFPEVLIVEDDAAQQEIIRRLATRCGYRSTIAGDLETAVSRLSRRTFSCITLDLSLHGHHGLKFLIEMAKTQPRAKLIVISGLEHKNIKLATYTANSLGLDVLGAYRKPLNHTELRKLLILGLGDAAGLHSPSIN